jgi:pimeloyl-ACP methyl ester carboxylesterase
MHPTALGINTLYTVAERPAHFRLSGHKSWAMRHKWLGSGVAGWLIATSNATAASVSLPLEDCQLASETARGDAKARCGWFEVAENRDDPSSKGIRIHVAVIPALRKQPLTDPLFIISGGPGQAASDFYLSSAGAFERLRSDRDLVIVDQRGTGKSQQLQCTLPDEFESVTFDKALLQRYARECLQSLPGDPRYYTTSVAVRDLDEIRQALGYEKINFYGVSYGTRVAQHYLRRYPQHVRAVILDGVVPVELALGPTIAVHAQQALDTLLTRCEADTACSTAFPNITATFSRLRSELGQQSVPISIPDPRTAKVTPLDFTAMHMAAALRMLSYSDDTASLLPFLIHEAAQQRPQAMAAQALLVSRNLRDQMAMGMQNAVICTEDVPFISDAAQNDPAIAASYLGRVFLDVLRANCDVWPRGVIDADFHAPLTSTVPALLLSGDNDPVTPASFGEQAVQGYSQGKHIVFAGQGHGQLSSRCGVSLIRRFIESGTTASLDTSCVAQVVPAPFIIDANGPMP